MSSWNLPLIDTFSSTTVANFWSSSPATNTSSGPRAWGANGVYVLTQSTISHSTNHDEITIVINSGPTGFMCTPTKTTWFVIAVDISGDSNSTIDIHQEGDETATQLTIGYLGIGVPEQSINLTSSAAGSAILINIKYTTVIEVTIKYFDNGDVTGIADQTIYYSYDATYVNFWSGDIGLQVGDPSTDTVISFFGVYSGEGPCFAHDSLIETVGGTKKIQDLTTTDVVVSDDGTLTSIVNVWRTHVPLVKECYTVDKIIVTKDHPTRQGDKWKQAGECIPGESKNVEGLFYQIETTGYGLRVGDYSFSTWTDKDRSSAMRSLFEF
jgi:hypothetical protein